jgi:colicin import membrane protein
MGVRKGQMADSNNLTEADILAMAQAADEGRDYNPIPKEDEKAKAETPAPEKASGDTEQKPAPAEEAETKQEASSEVSATEEKSEEAKSSLTTQPSEDKSESASEQKKPSRYEKAKGRLEKEWEDVRAEKARLKAEREAIEQAKAQREASQPGSETPKTGNRRFSADDYREAAKSYREEGRDDLAKLAETKATEVETEERKEIEQKTQTELKSAWDKNLLEEVEANPDLKDSNSSLYKAVSEMLQNHAILRNYPAGIKDAVGIAKIRLQAETASDLKKKVAEYERELAQLRKATTPASSQPSGPAKTKSFSELSLDEQERELMRMAGEVDRNG